MSDVELEQMKERLRQKVAERSQALAARLARARSDFDRIAAHIATAYTPRRIYQWGSLVDGRSFWERSDIDIALEGVTDAAAFFAILADAERMTRFPLDIVQMERIHPAYAESIRERGRIVFER